MLIRKHQNTVKEIQENAIELSNNIHTICSTDCSAFHDWQALLSIYSAILATQTGPITRFASGYSEDRIVTNIFKF